MRPSLYGEEFEIGTRLRDAGWRVVFTPEVEILHEIGVSTGRSRRQLVMHSAGIFSLLPQAPRPRLAARHLAARVERASSSSRVRVAATKTPGSMSDRSHLPRVRWLVDR